MTCRTCKFAYSDGETDSASIPVYWCRRFPPTMPPLVGGTANQFPKVRCTDRCAEHKTYTAAQSHSALALRHE